MAGLSDILAGLTAEEMASLKAEALCALIRDGSFSHANRTFTVATDTVTTDGFTWERPRIRDFTVAGIDITITAASFDRTRAMLTIWLTAGDANGPLPTPEMGYAFYNPPILVYQQGVAVEDIEASAHQFVYEAVVTYARDHGWSG